MLFILANDHDHDLISDNKLSDTCPYETLYSSVEWRRAWSDLLRVYMLFSGKIMIF